MSELKAVVTLGADVGGKDAHAATSLQCMALRRELARECVGPYGTAFDEFALVLRIDGSVQSWGKRGVDNVRLQRKSRYATADIFVPKEAWSADLESLRAFLATSVDTAIQMIVERAKGAGNQVDGNALLSDVRRATERFALLS